jgi:hypothetical protein
MTTGRINQVATLSKPKAERVHTSSFAAFSGTATQQSAVSTSKLVGVFRVYESSSRVDQQTLCLAGWLAFLESPLSLPSP